MSINRLNDSRDPISNNNKVAEKNIIQDLLNNPSGPIKMELDNIKNNYEKEVNAINTSTRSNLDNLMLELA